MPVSRYKKDSLIDEPRRLATAGSVSRIRSAVSSGRLAVTEVVLSEGQRLDHLAGQYLGDGRYWWLLAATSGVGWGLQVPAGTRILIPNDVSAALEIV